MKLRSLFNNFEKIAMLDASSKNTIKKNPNFGGSGGVIKDYLSQEDLKISIGSVNRNY